MAVAGYIGFVRVVDRIEKADDVNRLEELLEVNDAGAINVFEVQAHLLRAVLGSATASVEEALNDWDFSAALQALRAAKASRDEFK